MKTPNIYVFFKIHIYKIENCSVRNQDSNVFLYRYIAYFCVWTEKKTNVYVEKYRNIYV